jgi:RHS repeat-associated protein
LGRVIKLPFSNASVGEVEVRLPGFGDPAGSNPSTYSLLYKLRWEYLRNCLSSGSVRVIGDYDYIYSNDPQAHSEPSLFTKYSITDYVVSDGAPYYTTHFDPIVLKEIVLPNGKSYTFSYNIYGEIDKVTYPTGGFEKFAYGAVPPLSGSLDSFVYNQANRGVTDRWMSVTGDGSDEAQHHWTYAVDTSGPYLVRVTAPYGIKSERLLHRTAVNQQFGLDDMKTGRAYEERVISATGQMLRRTLTNWVTSGPAPAPPTGVSNATRNARITKTVEVLLDTTGNALAKTTTTNYDVDLNVIETKQYDYVSVSSTTGQTGDINSFPLGTLLRTGESTFLVNDTNILQATRDAYRARNLIALPTETKVKNGAGAVVAATKFAYDERALSTYGTITSWTDPATTVRGNPTTTQSWLNFNGTSFQTYPSGSFLTTKADYDVCGNVRKTTDANNKETLITYGDAFSDSLNRNTYAYPTRTETPIPDPSGYYGSSITLKNSTKYDYHTGKVTETKDANDRVTTYAYLPAGSFNRLDKVTLPDGGETAYEYGDTPGSVFVRTRVKQNAGTQLDDYVYFDGLGRAWRSGHYEGPGSWSVKDTQYDNLGRVWKVSNPYLAANLTGAINPSGVWTTTAYDSLGRVLSVTTPDGSKVETTYEVNKVTVKDPANKQRRSVTDGLGRLIQVFEDPAGVNYQTDYLYDSLGNLAKVTQGAQNRYFLYDSLSRLIRAKNPEQNSNGSIALSDPLTTNSQWSLKYVYDANSNLTSKVDARNVTTSYGYDALNRNIWVVYNDGTPTLERHYDGAINNGQGRLAYHVNYTLNPATGQPGYSRLVIGGYDSVGRVTSQTQGFLNNSGSAWIDFQVSRNYDLAGHVTSQTYPSGRSLSQSYNAGGRLASANGNLGGASYTYADTISYNAAGQITRERFGTATALYHNLHYNNRLQLVDIRLGDSPSDEWNWSRGALISYYGTNAVANWNPLHNDTDNNGNLRRQVNYVPLAGGGSVIPQLDDYTYDGLNRIASMTEAQQNSSGQWTSNVTSQTFSYDRWGNRLSVTGYNPQSYDTAEAAATNRLRVIGTTGCPASGSRLCYDSAGNLIFDNVTGTGDRSYDGENRMITAAGGGLNKYVYDSDGRRVRRQVGAQQFWQVYGIDGELLAEYEWNGTTASLRKEYGYRDGQLLVIGESPSSGNLALGKTATQSSTGYSSPASRAVDGNTDGNWANGSVTHTNLDHQPWWEVDLGSIGQIGSVKVWNRTDCCSDRLSNFYVLVSDVPFTSTDLTTTLGQPGVSNYYTAGPVGTMVEVSVNRSGRYVRVQLAGDNYLHLAEVEVLGGGTVVRWMVGDQLGTLRMIADQTGSLAGMRRHDYLPFGEENQAGGAIRSAANGYQQEGVRQKHTGYERDNETGLDFAQARYYSNIQGRFTGPDAPFADQFESDPQSWNLYAYVRNNPCVNTDPTGRNTCYFRPDGSKIGCEGDTRIKIVTQSGEGQLIFTPKKGEREVYDLNNVQAVTYASTSINPIGELGFEMNRRASGTQGLIGITLAAGAVGGTGVGAGLYVGGGAGITTLGLSGAGAGAASSPLVGSINTVIAGYRLTGAGELANGTLTLNIEGLGGQALNSVGQPVGAGLRVLAKELVAAARATGAQTLEINAQTVVKTNLPGAMARVANSMGATFQQVSGNVYRIIVNLK